MAARKKSTPTPEQDAAAVDAAFGFTEEVNEAIAIAFPPQPPASEPTFVLSRAEKGSQRTFLMVTYPECKHEKRVEPYSTRDGEFMFRVPKHCPTCGDVYYYFVTDAKALKPLDNVPST